MATGTQTSDKTVTYEMAVRRGGRWVAAATYPMRDRALALYDAKKLAQKADVEATKVTKEAWSEDTGEAETLVIYRSSDSEQPAVAPEETSADFAPRRVAGEHVVIPTLVRARFDAFELALVRGLGERVQTLDSSQRFALGLYLTGAADRLIAAEGLSPESAQLLLTSTLTRLGASSDNAREYGAAMNDYLVQARALAMYKRGRHALARQLAGDEDAIDIEAALAE